MRLTRDVSLAETKQGFWRTNNPLMWASFATAVFFVLLLFLGSSATCNIDLFPKGDCPPKWRHLQAAPFNEVGDTLAGIAGVLAFIWLIATVLLQSIELGEQRRVLRMQKQEMEEQRKATQEMAIAQRKQVELLSIQAEVFREEQQQRKQEKAKLVLEQRLGSLRNYIVDQCEELGWYSQSRDDGFHMQIHPYTLFRVREDMSDLSIDDFIWKQYLSIAEQTQYIQSNHSELDLGRSPSAALALNTKEKVQESLSLADELSGDQLERLGKIGMYGISAHLDTLMALPIWSDLPQEPAK